MKGTSSATSHKTAPTARREIDYSLIIAPAALVICVIFFTIMNPRFISLDNLMNILRQGGPLFIVSFGLVGVILIGSIDISSDGLLSLAGVSAVMLANIVQDGGGWLSVLLGTGIGLVFGVFMGFLVSYVRLPSFLVTYGTSTICRGIALIVSGGIAQNTMFVQFKKLGSGSVGFLPTLAIFSAVILILMVVLTTKTKYGRSLYAMGSNERVAGLCGLPTRKYKLIAFTVAGACTGLAGVLMSARLGAGTHSQGQGMSLDAIAAVVMGGTSLSGGKGSVTRTITGVFVILMLNNGLNLMGVSPHVQILVKGIVVILAVAASSDWKSKDIVK
ncbi:ABC transporter permease [Anaerotruncus massiliensis (ex Liu et al. 2021)]|uniref:Autoinducer 2 import system permease protein LsrD n=2 Tax=Anaerotruncus TaxID=244127 RepID=A0A498CNZ6_9FIRM|nr:MULTISPECIES: ABC transporter permease [Anaerotruncus]MBC3937765.1 ABC transporter permease [Anaerotruncus massiliensis (ex Togo et al. 2019)]RLL13766.1 ABC transporter permease [Anaerotruncus massiliensis (ex Liu et al. 2021)]